jgi:ketosteroid isomerase-like protein
VTQAVDRGAEHLARYFAAWQRLDADEVAGLYGANAVMVDPTLAVPRQGREQVRAYFAEMFGSLEDPVHDLLDHAERNGRVWFEWTFGSGGRSRPLERYRGVSIQTLDASGLIVHDASYWVPGARAHAWGA